TYTAHQSPQSSESAQTTIVHGVPPGMVPFSIDALRDQHHMSDTEFDTPSQPEAEPETVNSTIRAEEASWDPTRLRRNKSIMHCNICNRIWEYNQIHCPGCAARTLHHIPGSSDDSYTDSEYSNHDPRTLHHRPVRHNPERDVLPTESSWDAYELEAGTAEESWATTAADATSLSASPKPAQASTEQSTETHPPSTVVTASQEWFGSIAAAVPIQARTRTQALNYALNHASSTHGLSLQLSSLAALFLIKQYADV
ncbi:hypothetical protein KCU73_g15484, partial [Aureobasidium melanogenum]